MNHSQMPNKNVVFVSTVAEWESCEELWSGAARDLASQGFSVSASVVDSLRAHPRIRDLEVNGVTLQFRPRQYSPWERAWYYAFFRGKSKAALELKKCLHTRPSPQLVVLSEGNSFPPIEMLELCISLNLPFVTISHLLWDGSWPSDSVAERYRAAFDKALRCYFVSNANLRLMEKQIGFEFSNAEVVRNPYKVGFNSVIAWPASTLDQELRLACVGRLFPIQKGQDLLLEALGRPAWAKRDWHLTLYGKGGMQNSLERLAVRLGISNRVTFAGYVDSVEEIWASNHVLVMPSRFEGLPVAMVEAMLCGRPVLATDVAGHSEVITDGVTGFLAGAPTAANVVDGLERLWASRANLESMGNAGAKRIRELVPADPAGVFSSKLQKLMSQRDFSDRSH